MSSLLSLKMLSKLKAGSLIACRVGPQSTGCYPTVLRCIYYAGIIVSSGCVLALNLAFIADKDQAEYILCLTNTLFIITPYNTALRDNKLEGFLTS